MPRTYFDRAGSSESPGTTTNATKTTVFTYTPPATCAGIVSVCVTGHTAGGAVVATYKKAVSIKKISGALTIVGAASGLFASHREPGALLWGDIEFAASGGDLLVQATGALATTITWWTTIEAELGNVP